MPFITCTFGGARSNFKYFSFTVHPNPKLVDLNTYKSIAYYFLQYCLAKRINAKGNLRIKIFQLFIFMSMSKVKAANSSQLSNWL